MLGRFRDVGGQIGWRPFLAPSFQVRLVSRQSDGRLVTQTIYCTAEGRKKALGFFTDTLTHLPPSVKN
jgi:hypothetical protein